MKNQPTCEKCGKEAPEKFGVPLMCGTDDYYFETLCIRCAETYQRNGGTVFQNGNSITI